MAERVVGPHVVLVEGKDDKNVYAEIAKRCGVIDLQIIDVGGTPQIRPQVKAVLTAAEESVRSITILRDAGGDPQAAIDSSRDALQSAGLPAPQQMWTVSNPGVRGIRTAVGIVPSDRPGGIESLFRQASREFPVHQCVIAFMECAASKDPGPTRTPEALDKSFVRALLAIGTNQPHTVKSGLPLGLACKTRLWDLTAAPFAPIVNLFSLLSSI